jgi:hypothetical protein
MSSTEPPPADTAPPPNLLRRAVLVVTSPAELFRILGQHPSWLGALLMGAVFLSLSSVVIPLDVWEEGLRTRMLEMDQEVPADLTTMTRVFWVFSVFGAFVIWPLVGVISAGIYSVIFLFVFGFDGSFRRMLSVTAHALLVAAFGMLLLAPLRIAAEDPQLTLSVGTFFGFLEGGFWKRFLELLDLFNLWAYVLVGLGASVVDGRRSPAFGVGISVGAGLLLSLVIAAFTG